MDCRNVFSKCEVVLLCDFREKWPFTLLKLLTAGSRQRTIHNAFDIVCKTETFAMSSKTLLTLKYLFKVKGYHSIPEGSFPYRMGCHNSDKFTISLTNDEYFSDGISLSEYHAAFLCSPVFQLELWLLSKLSAIDPITTTNDHLRSVAVGERSSFGPWTAWAVEGNRSSPLMSNTPKAATESFSKEHSSKTPCVIMRCRTSKGPFCDTWWALEFDDSHHPSGTLTSKHPQLVFGTSLLGSSSQSIFIRILMPLHQLYSRLLLASCKATLVYQSRNIRK
jgi:hypothetical protein